MSDFLKTIQNNTCKENANLFRKLSVFKKDVKQKKKKKETPTTKNCHEYFCKYTANHIFFTSLCPFFF